jgi:Domain of unknown function (DUF4340)
MKLRDLSIAMLVLVALLGVLYWSNHRKEKEDAGVKASADVAPKILALNQADIAEVRIERKGRPSLDLSRDQSGNWQIIAPKPMSADQQSVSGVLSSLSSLNSERLLEDNVGDVSGYGLTDPALQIVVTMKDHKTQRLLVGDQSPAGNSFYAMLAGDLRLFTLASYSKTSLDKSANDLRDKRLLTADFDKVSQIDLLNQSPGKNQDITFAREKDAWQIVKPKPSRADTLQVEDLIRALREARFETAADNDDAKLAAAFRSAKPAATAKVVGAGGTQEMELRKNGNDYLAKSSITSGIYKVPASLGTSLDKTLDDFRNKNLFDFGYQDLSKIEIHDGSKAYFLTHLGTDWWGSDGKKLDESSAEMVISRLRELSAKAFPDSGFSSPTIEIIVTSQDNKRVEKVSLAKSGDSYIATRENEPVLYAVPGAAVEGLQKAASDLKPASPPRK